jgi:NADPH-dependent F420 reductase
MKITVIGTGNVGSVLGSRWAEQGHQVIFGTRDPHSDKIQKLLAEAGPNAGAAQIGEAITGSEVVVLATPWPAVQEIVEGTQEWGDRIIIDCTNPIGPGLGLVVGHTTSGAEQVAAWARSHRVVKAFNTTGAENMADPSYQSQPITMFICSDDSEAKAAVARLAEELGFEVADTGKLAMARYLEPLAMVWINLAIVQKQGRDMAFKLVRR